VEHADGTACCAELADGEWQLLQGLGTGAVLEAKCEYRVQECVTMARALQALNAGELHMFSVFVKLYIGVTCCWAHYRMFRARG
jgi:hypothetical protein